VLVLLRAQLCVMYLFASLWKIHPDWLSGQIISGIFLSFEAQGDARGIPWAAISEAFPQIWVIMACVGFSLDAMMFCSMAFVRRAAIQPFVVIAHLCFHGFTFIAMAPRIGVHFPLVCICATTIFLPIGGAKEDVCLAKSVYRIITGAPARSPMAQAECAATDDGAVKDAKGQKTIKDGTPSAAAQETSATDDDDDVSGTTEKKKKGNDAPLAAPPAASRWQRVLFTAWFLTQLYLPLRMPLISNGEFVSTGEGYRWSWTMMLHSTTYIMDFGPLQVGFYEMLPSCPGKGPIPRSLYAPHMELRGENPLSLPINAMFQGRYNAALKLYARQIPKVVYGIAVEMNQLCQNNGGHNISMSGRVFVAENDNGIYARLVDPTVDLMDVGRATLARTPLEVLKGVILEKPTHRKHEHLLHGVRHGLGLAEKRAILDLVKSDSGADNAYLIADRSPCLRAQPVNMILHAYKQPYFKVLKSPGNVTVFGCSKETCDWATRASCKKDKHCGAMELEHGVGRLLPKAFMIELRIGNTATVRKYQRKVNTLQKFLKKAKLPKALLAKFNQAGIRELKKVVTLEEGMMPVLAKHMQMNPEEEAKLIKAHGQWRATPGTYACADSDADVLIAVAM